MICATTAPCWSVSTDLRQIHSFILLFLPGSVCLLRPLSLPGRRAFQREPLWLASSCGTKSPATCQSSWAGSCQWWWWSSLCHGPNEGPGYLLWCLLQSSAAWQSLYWRTPPDRSPGSHLFRKTRRLRSLQNKSTLLLCENMLKYASMQVKKL